jgi:hypothetical protein
MIEDLISRSLNTFKYHTRETLLQFAESRLHKFSAFNHFNDKSETIGLGRENSIVPDNIKRKDCEQPIQLIIDVLIIVEKKEQFQT